MFCHRYARTRADHGVLLDPAAPPAGLTKPAPAASVRSLMGTLRTSYSRADYLPCGQTRGNDEAVITWVEAAGPADPFTSDKRDSHSQLTALVLAPHLKCCRHLPPASHFALDILHS